MTKVKKCYLGMTLKNVKIVSCQTCRGIRTSKDLCHIAILVLSWGQKELCQDSHQGCHRSYQCNLTSVYQVLKNLFSKPSSRVWIPQTIDGCFMVDIDSQRACWAEVH